MKMKTELTFPAKLKDEPILCNLCKKINIILNILEASFSTETGWAIIILEGKSEEIEKALTYLKNQGVEIEDNQEIQRA
jgi:L-aspartate semialdehyde sulfurtransferase ferredoxin